MKPRAKSSLENADEIKRIDKSSMIQFSVNASQHYGQAIEISKKVSIDLPKLDNIVIAGMGGSGIGGLLLKDYARNQAPVSIEVSQDYTIPKYADHKTLVLVVSYSGDTEESLSSFLEAQKRRCMTYCLSSGGTLLEFAEKLKVPFIRIPRGMPPRAASPYLLVPQLLLLEKLHMISGVSRGLNEAVTLLERISLENAPEQSIESSPAKSLASRINGTAPVVYGFDIYRGVAQRWKQQFNENSKVPAKWEVFPELNHNEIVGWEKAGVLADQFSMVFIRDKSESDEVRSRIEITKTLLPQVSKKFEVWAQGKSILAKMLSTMLVGDFTSVYLAILRGVDPTPVQTISTLKRKLSDTGTKEKIIRELEKLKPAQ